MTIPSAAELRGRARILSAKHYAGTIRSHFPYWDTQIRPFLLRVIEAIPADRLDFKPQPALFTARQAVAHIAEGEFVWVHTIMGGRAIDERNNFVVPHEDPAQGWKLTREAGDHASLFTLSRNGTCRPSSGWTSQSRSSIA